MALRGKQQRGRAPSYDPDSGQQYRATMTLSPRAAASVVTLAVLNRRSVTSVASDILERVGVDETGRLFVVDPDRPLAFAGPDRQQSLDFTSEGVA